MVFYCTLALGRKIPWGKFFYFSRDNLP
ncbi:hypothetical protein cbdbB23 [Dehalococcoides mccartyi CBDB1]|uniref:Uncharacterized protein n=1 Tax=Dehalococcoides mccartyi (strain CBDB1) TaxID=255470 RepID=A0A916KMR4_DEHMC|nr:hypothetical protein cbdbB23 [Dehalococcoides mccartyi CBDB1]